jgi:hypothetical protein
MVAFVFRAINFATESALSAAVEKSVGTKIVFIWMIFKE